MRRLCSNFALSSLLGLSFLRSDDGGYAKSVLHPAVCGARRNADIHLRELLTVLRHVSHDFKTNIGCLQHNRSMRNLLLLLIIGLAAYGGFTIWDNHRKSMSPPKVAEVKSEETALPLPADPAPTPAPQTKKIEAETPKVEAEPPMPLAPVKRLAPEGVFYAVQAFSVMTEDGVRGIRAGTPVKLVKDNGTTIRVTDGKQEFDAKREHLTNDLDLASQAVGNQVSQQAATAEWHEKQKAMAAVSEQQKMAETVASTDAAQRNIALNALMARQDALQLEAAKIQASITTYESAPRRAGQQYYDQYGVRRVVVGDTHVNDLIALRQKLAVINSDLSKIATRINQIQR